MGTPSHRNIPLSYPIKTFFPHRKPVKLMRSADLKIQVGLLKLDTIFGACFVQKMLHLNLAFLAANVTSWGLMYHQINFLETQVLKNMFLDSRKK